MVNIGNREASKAGTCGCVKIGNCELENNVFLAPMAGITDLPFRILCYEQGCGLAYTEMVSAKGMFYGSEKTGDLLKIDEREGKVGIQLFGSEAEILADIVKKLAGLDNVLFDINMGCPAPKITRNGDGSALMKDIDKAERVIKAVVAASKEYCDKPVTVKFRKGWDDDSINGVEFAQMAEAAGADAITIHGRTRKQFYSGQADWNIIKRIKEKVEIPVIGNGDITSGERAKAMFEETGCDAIMVGRASQGNPWIFNEINVALGYADELLPKQRLETIVRHFAMLIDLKGERTAVNEMRMHIPCYVKGLPNAATFRNDLMKLSLFEDVLRLLENFLQ